MSSDAATNTTDQWMQYFQQAMSIGGSNPHMVLPSGHQYSDATTVTSSVASADGSLSPQGNIAKPVRRRSRASRRTPTTLLNASTTNFRALVQQYTGCQSANNPSLSRSSSSPSTQKGPINLSFGLSSTDHQDNMNINPIIPNMSASFGYDHHHYYNQQQPQQLYHNIQEGDHHPFSFGNNHNGDSSDFQVFGSANDHQLVTEDFSSHDQTTSSHAAAGGMSSTYVHTNDGYYYN